MAVIYFGCRRIVDASFSRLHLNRNILQLYYVYGGVVGCANGRCAELSS